MNTIELGPMHPDKPYLSLCRGKIQPLLEEWFTQFSAVDAAFTLMENMQLAEELLQPPDLEYAPLFAGTAYEHLLPSSPYVCRLLPEHAFTALLVAGPDEFGFFCWGESPRRIQIKHWASLLNAVMPENLLSHFRFYSPSIMAALLQVCSKKEVGWLLGPNAGIAVPLGNDAWLCASNPLLESVSAKDLAANYTPASAPWWQVTDEQLTGLAPQLHKTLRHNHIMAVQAEHSELLADFTTLEACEDFFSAAMHKAAQWGLAAPEFQFGFILQSLRHGQKLNNDTACKAILENMRLEPEDKLQLLAAYLEKYNV